MLIFGKKAHYVLLEPRVSRPFSVGPFKIDLSKFDCSFNLTRAAHKDAHSDPPSSHRCLFYIKLLKLIIIVELFSKQHNHKECSLSILKYNESIFFNKNVQ